MIQKLPSRDHFVELEMRFLELFFLSNLTNYSKSYAPRSGRGYEHFGKHLRPLSPGTL